MNELYERLKSETEEKESSKARVNLYLDKELKEKLQIIASYEGNSLNQQINAILSSWVTDFEKRAVKEK